MSTNVLCKWLRPVASNKRSVLVALLIILHQQLLLCLPFLDQELHGDRQHRVDSSHQRLFVILRKQTYPIVHEQTCIANNCRWISYIFPFKTCCTMSLPNGPTNSRNPGTWNYLLDGNHLSHHPQYCSRVLGISSASIAWGTMAQTTFVVLHGKRRWCTVSMFSPK